MKQKEKRYIGVKDLGNLTKKDFCPRCFWYEMNYGPFPSFFPGVFNIIDRNLKNSVWLRWKKERKLPDWLKIKNVKRILTTENIGVVEERYGQKYLVGVHSRTGFILRGAPDLILELEDNTIHIIDFKTAKFKGGAKENELFSVYEAQLNGYALLATKALVSKLSLVYFNPTNQISEEFFIANNFKLAFEPKIIEIEIKPYLVGELLMRAKEILDYNRPPRAKNNCHGTCYYIEKILTQVWNS